VERDVHALAPDRVNVPPRDMPSFRYAWGCSTESKMVHEPVCHVFGE
jgi:predicted metalloendopeptidase